MRARLFRTGFGAALKAADAAVTRPCALIGALAMAMALYTVYALQIVNMDNLILPTGLPIGGDYAAFWTAAQAMAGGDAAAIYDRAAFTAWLEQVGPERERWGLTWQYPPTYYFVISFLAVLPYALGYALWTGGGLAIFAGGARGAGLRGDALVILLAAPVLFQAAITGQNGFLTASLLAGATLLVDKRPVLAGLCAAALTVKPQLGLLIPFAYMAGGHWRAFIAAALGALALAGASIGVFGFAPWAAFYQSLFGVGANVATGAMPLFKMPTVFAAFSMAGLPAQAALGFHLLGAGAAVAATVMIWRRSRNPALKTAVVACGAFLTAPYAYYYEMVIMAVPIALLALQGAQDGWRPYERLFLSGLFMAPVMLPGDAAKLGFNLGFLVTVMAMTYVLHCWRAETQTARRDFIAAASVPSSR